MGLALRCQNFFENVGKIDGLDEVKRNKGKGEGLSNYVLNVTSAFRGAQKTAHRYSDNYKRTIYIDNLGVKATDFDEIRKQVRLWSI